MNDGFPRFLWLDYFKRKASSRELLLRTLRENMIFSSLTDRELKYVSTFVYERTYQPGEYVFKEDDRGFGMYLVAQGAVAIKMKRYGEEMLATRLGRGCFFGELSLIDQENIRSAAAIAQEKTLLLGFFKPDFQELLTRKPALGVKLLFQLTQVLASRLLHAEEDARSVQTDYLAHLSVVGQSPIPFEHQEQPSAPTRIGGRSHGGDQGKGSGSNQAA
jgi:CRP-like cAMP-binding protein